MDSCTFFEEDEVYVYKTGKGYKFGLVIENSEYVSSDEEDESEKQEDRLHKGSIRVAWHPSGKETVVPENKVKLADRSLMPGDVVRRHIPGEDTQCGFVMDMDVRAHLHILRTNKYIYNVDSKDLEPIQKFESGQEVILGLWWGKVETVTTDIDLVFPDGARCRVDEGEISGAFEESSDKPRMGEFSMCIYYPGQDLRGPIDALSTAKWLHSTPRYCHKVASKIGKSRDVNCIIEKIVARSVEVHWVFGGSNGTEDVSTPPPRIIEGEQIKQLKILDWFSHCSLQIGDRQLYCIKNDDRVVTLEPEKAFDPACSVNKDVGVVVSSLASDGLQEEEKNNEVTNTASPCEAEAKPIDDSDADYEDVNDSEDSDCEKAVSKWAAPGGRSKKKNKVLKTGAHRFKSSKPAQKSVVRKPRKQRIVKPDSVMEVETQFTTSWAKVMWQDGQVESDIPSVDLFPVHHLDELEFFPGDFVLPDIELPSPCDYGVVASVNHFERTAVVHWYKFYDARTATCDSKPTLVEGDCEMSVYDLKDHPDYKFRPSQSIVPVGGLSGASQSSQSTTQPAAGGGCSDGSEGDGGNVTVAGDAASSATGNLTDDANVKKTQVTSAPACQTVGQIIELDANGHLVIKWADGSVSQRYPQEVFVVSDEADEDTENFDDEWDSESDYESNASSSASWETESEEEVEGEDLDDSKAEGKDDSGCDPGALASSRLELDSLLGRAGSALSRLQRLLHTFDSTVSAPECFHDILRIYRNCHDLDKILKSSFFSDPELVALIGQAKQELKRDKNNKISRHLTQLFEAWSRSVPPSPSGRTFGLVGVDGKTITFGNSSTAVSEAAADILAGKDAKDGEEGSMAAVDKSEMWCVVKSESDKPTTMSDNVSNVLESQEKKAELMVDKTLKKEWSEPAISCSVQTQAVAGSPRRPSDPVLMEGAASSQPEAWKAEANLVGENCVAKGAKRSKSVSIEESGHEAKKSRDDDNRDPNLAAQELCFKICKGLQRQIALIHEDMNKRTQRLFSTLDNERQTENERLKQKLIETEKKLLETKSKMNAEIAADQQEQVLGASHVDSRENSGDAGPGDCLSAKPLEEDPQNVTHKVNKLPGPLSMPGVTDATQEKGAGREEDSTKAEASKSPDPSDDDLSADLSISNIVGAENVACKGFQMLSEAPPQHQFFKKESQPSNPRTFRNSVRKEMKLFQSSLPDGIFVHGFEDRLDLFSVMILGPCGTPYEDAVFLFDLMLPNDYPTSPPTCHYHSYCTDRLNPNLYEDGKVCVSLLGTWSGKGNEMWTCKSNMLQVLVSIQGLILVREPYYNEAGFERQRGTQVGEENSRVYNEMAVLKTCQSLTRMCQRLPGTFKEEIQNYLLSHGPRMISRLDKWMEMSQSKKPTSLDAASVLSGIEKTQSLSQMSPHQNSQNTDTHIDKSIQADPPETTLLKDNLLEAVAQSDKQEDCVNRSQGTMGNMSDKLSDLSLEKRKDTNACGLEETDPSLASPDNKGASGGSSEFSEPEFPLFPMSKGFCITLRNHLRVYKKTLEQLAQQASAAGSVSAEDAV